MVGPMLQCCNGRSNARSNGPMVGPMAQWSVQWSKVCPMVQRSTARTCVRSTAHVCADVPTPPGGRYIHGYIHTKPWKMQAQLPLSTYAYIHMYIHTNIHAYIHTHIHTYTVMSACAPARARARALCFLSKKGDDFASWFSDKVGTFVIVPP